MPAHDTVRVLTDFFGTNTKQPPTPFATTWYQIIDTIRFIDIALVGLTIGRVLFGFAKGWIYEKWRRIAWVGVIVYSISMAMTEADKIGYPIGRGGRLWWNTIGIVIYFAASFKVMNHKSGLPPHLRPLE